MFDGDVGNESRMIYGSVSGEEEEKKTECEILTKPQHILIVSPIYNHHPDLKRTIGASRRVRLPII